MTVIIDLLRFGSATFIALTAAVAVLALLGFASADLDALNNLQVLIFLATLLGLLLLVIFLPGNRVMITIAVVGFVASATTYVPETLSVLAPRPPLPTDGRPVLKVMTHNLFGLNYDMPRVAANIFAEDPDIVALQEYFLEQRGPLAPLLVQRYPYSAFCIGGKRANVAIYAKLPFKETATGACSTSANEETRTSRLVGTFTLADGTTFSVLTTHLDWPLPAWRQRLEMSELADQIAAVTGPLLVVGDMNSTPWSYALRGLVARSGLIRQSRNLVTWPLLFGGERDLIATIPFLPLDQVMTRGIAVHTIRTGQADGSDHLPVVFTFSVE